MARVRLTQKQRSFADIYIETGNATQSYIDAGYSATTRAVAEANARKLLGNNSVKKYMDERMEELKTERVADQQEIMELLTSIVRGEATASTLIGVGGGAERIERDMPPTMTERVRAAELLGRRYAMWTDRQQVEDVTPVFVEDVPNDD